MAAGTQFAETFFNAAAQRFFSPSRWFWGPTSGDQAAVLLSELEDPLLVCDAAIRGHPLVQRLAAGVRWRDEHPVSGFACTEHARALAPRVGAAGAVVVIGGGTAIDTAKAALAQWLYGDLDGVGMGARRGELPRPGHRRPILVALPSTCGAGAEASRYYVTYRQADRAKVHGKSWALVADWIFCDPALLAGAPARLVVETAFDAFVHFWESSLCRFEGGLLSRALALHGIETVVSQLPAALRREPAALAALGYAGTLGGVAISNVRTGHVHEAAGALLEATALSHGATLQVFFREANRPYAELLAADRERRALIVRLTGDPQGRFEALADWWQAQFAAVGSRAGIRAALAGLDLATAGEAIVARVLADRVWCDKESPMPLGDDEIRRFVATALREAAN